MINNLIVLYENEDFKTIKENLSHAIDIKIQHIYELYKKCINKRNNKENRNILYKIHRYIIRYMEEEKYDDDDQIYFNKILFDSAKYGLNNFIDILLECYEEIDPNIRNRNGNTAYIMAAQNNRRFIIERLSVDSRIQKNLKNKRGYSALEIAFISGHDNLVKILKNNGAKVNFFTSPILWYKILKI